MALPLHSVTVERLAYGSAGIAHVDGQVVFIPGTVPGDEVVVEIESQKKNYATARVMKIRSPSPFRRQPPCSYVSQCGGCPWQHIAYQEQLRAKETLVREQLRRIGGLTDIPLLPIISSPEEWRYRQRLRLHIDRKGRVGLLAPRSHKVVTIDSCSVAWEALPSHLRVVREWIASLRTIVPQVELAVEDPVARPEEQRVMVLGQAQGPFQQKDEQACRLLETHPLVAGVMLRGKDWRHVWGDTSRTFIGKDKTLTIHDGAFTQVNNAANQLLVEAVLRHSAVRSTDTVIELYCGSGNFSVSFARRAREFIGIEQDGRAITDARVNAARAGVANMRFLHASASVGVRELLVGGARGDVVVLDPPRSGAADIIDDLPRFGARVITYVSCDPATLARDLRRLHQRGYQLQAVQPLDMFPQTYHVEVVAVSVLTC
ncbi:MAG: 23S rRNA (uracil(1939)-C(5))-methyltransferase RlmD [Candidatus Binatia bacterium]